LTKSTKHKNKNNNTSKDVTERTHGSGSSQSPSKIQKGTPMNVNIEDIAIIRETLAEDDLEELTALDLEKQNLKSTISGTGAGASAIIIEGSKQKSGM